MYRIKYKDGVEKRTKIPKGDGLIPRHFLAQLTLAQMCLVSKDGVEELETFMNRTDYPYKQDNTGSKIPDIRLEGFYGPHVLAVTNKVVHRVWKRNQDKGGIRNWTNNSKYLQVLLHINMIRDILRTLTHYGPNPKYDRTRNSQLGRFFRLNICKSNIDTNYRAILCLYPLFI